MTAPPPDRGPGGRPRGRARRPLAAAALATQVVLAAAVALDAPFELRMPLAIAYAFTVPGFAVVGLIRLGDPVTELASSVAVSIGLGITAAQLLVWVGAYSLASTLGLLATVTVVGLVAQLASTAQPRPVTA